MSRIGRLPIRVPSGVTIESRSGEVVVKGPKGTLTERVAPLVDIRVDNGQIVVERQNDSKPARAQHGLMRALVNNMVTGVTKGFEKRLQIEGTGFRAEVKGRSLVLTLGYSHPVNYAIPQGVDIAVDKQTVIVVKGVNRQQVGQVAANIRGFRKPDSYKGKGIRYEGERLRLKEGKTA